MKRAHLYVECPVPDCDGDIGPIYVYGSVAKHDVQVDAMDAICSHCRLEGADLTDAQAQIVEDRALNEDAEIAAGLESAAIDAAMDAARDAA